MKKNRAFTLIELLIAVSIISMLSSVILVSINKARQTAINSKYSQEVNNLRTAILMYKENTGALPSCPGANPVVGETPGTCYDFGGRSWLTNALTPVVNAGLISGIPHYAGFPQNSFNSGNGKPWAYTQYLPNIYNYAGVTASEFSCREAAWATWTNGSLPGVLLINTSETLPFSKGYWQCDTSYGGCVFNDPGAYNLYCLSLDY